MEKKNFVSTQIIEPEQELFLKCYRVKTRHTFDVSKMYCIWNKYWTSRLPFIFFAGCTAIFVSNAENKTCKNLELPLWRIVTSSILCHNWCLYGRNNNDKQQRWKMACNLSKMGELLLWNKNLCKTSFNRYMK